MMKKYTILLLVAIFSLTFSCVKKQISEKIDNVEVTEKVVVNEEVKKEVEEEKQLEYGYNINLDDVFSLDEILRYKYKNLINDIDPEIKFDNVDLNYFYTDGVTLFIGLNDEIQLDIDKFKRIFKPGYNFPSLYEGEELKPIKRNIIPNKKYISFTFDDGPGNKYHELIREELNKYDFSGTFFVVGSRVKRNPNMLKQTYLDGHEIQNHSYNHPDFKKRSEKVIWDEFALTNDEIFKVIGIDAEIIRPPYGSYDSRVKRIFDNKLALWSVDSEDWKSRNVQTIIDRVLPVVKDGDVVLFHDLYLESYEAVKYMLPILKERGFQLVTFSELLEIKENRQKGEN